MRINGQLQVVRTTRVSKVTVTMYSRLLLEDAAVKAARSYVRCPRATH